MPERLPSILILCTGNSARSQMAEGLLRRYGKGRLEVESAGVEPSTVRPLAIEAMAELGIDISDHSSKSVDRFQGRKFDYVITVCDNARESCPVFPARTQRVHWSIEDPADASGSREEQLAVYRRVRDHLAERLRSFAEGIGVEDIR
jgi:arsenate reductase (thioredoxin)